jgi:CRP-like cAMP-binding protein
VRLGRPRARPARGRGSGVPRGDATVAKLAAGDVFGEIGLLVTGTRTASVVATTPMRVLGMFTQDYQRITQRMPIVAQSLRQTMRERIAELPLPRGTG